MPAPTEGTAPPILLPPPAELAALHGLWVTVVRGVVVGTGKSPRTALNRATANGHPQPDLVFRAPLRPSGRAYYQLTHSPA